MDHKREIDWMDASAPERIEPTQALYRIMRALAQATGARFDDLVETAQDAPVSASSDPHRNFRRGQIARSKAASIHEWLATHHFAFAQKRAPELFRFPRQSDWDRFVADHAIAGSLTVIPLVKSMGIARRSKTVSHAVTTLRLGQDYCLELESRLEGQCVAFEGYNGSWYPLPLGDDERRLRVIIPEGATLLPRDRDGYPIALVELDHGGVHRFVVIVSDDKALPTDRPSLAQLGQGAAAFEVHVLEVNFTS
ncbi:hypothetical protein [Roseovarius sp. MMSF_3350]|uniref:hypothetical protein n=1 Tax=Roseovarius sp. MMSF_3350 TaxID=3046706 RepID=UPI00273EA272|nr:hypothetical protein [Roseovarius sp. MMSF_3350]